MKTEQKTIYCLHKHLSLLDTLADQLVQAGHKTRHFSALESLLVSVGKQFPDLIIISAEYLEHLSPLSLKIEEIAERHRFQIQIATIGTDSSITEQHLALSFGWKNYLHPPHDVKRLKDALLDSIAATKPCHSVLVITNDNTQAEYAVTALKHAGHQTHVCTTIDQIPKRVQQLAPDLILMDSELGEVSGENIAWILRHQLVPYVQPIILRKAQFDNTERSQLLKLGIDDVIKKPTSTDLLLDTVEGRIQAAQLIAGHHTKPPKPKPIQPITEADNDSQLESSSTLKTATRALLTTLQQALTQNTLRTQYQPIVNLGKREQVCYELILQLPNKQGNNISHRERRRIGRHKDINRKIDYWMIKQAVTELQQLNHQFDDPILFVETSAQTPTYKGLVAEVSELLLKAHVNGRGLVLSFRLADMASDIRASQANIRALKALGVRVAVCDFVNKDTAFQMLKFSQASFIKPAAHLINIDSKAIDKMTKKIQQLSVKTIISRVDSIDSVNLNWVQHADYAQGKLIHAPMPEMDFDFSEAVI